MQAIIKRELVIDKRICQLLAAGAFVVLTALSAFVRIPLPFTPVPLTLQTFFVLLSGALLGRRLGLFAQGVYIFLGFIGLQIFTGSGSGMLYLLGPTGGYIFGFILATFFAGSLFVQKKQSVALIFLKFLFCDFIILFSGMFWLKITLSCSLTQAFLFGVLPFIFADLLKVILATAVYSKTHSRIKAVLY